MVDKKILLVEDDSIEALDMKHSLKSLGYEVSYIASSGEEAIKEALSNLPDLILMDIILSGDVDGLKLLPRLKI